MTDTKQSPLPWVFNQKLGEIQDANGCVVVAETNETLGEEFDGPAELIVRAVNSHDALVEALEKVSAALDAAPIPASSIIKFTGDYKHLGFATVGEALDEADFALALAKGEQP